MLTTALRKFVPEGATCCWCSSSKTGARLIGTGQVILSSVMMIHFTVSLCKTLLFIIDTTTTFVALQTLQFNFGVTFAICNLALGIILLKGVNEDIKRFVGAWIIGFSLVFFILATGMILGAYLIYTSTWSEGGILVPMIIAALIFLALLMYCLLVVTWYYQHRMDRRRGPRDRQLNED